MVFFIHKSSTWCVFQCMESQVRACCVLIHTVPVKWTLSRDFCPPPFPPGKSDRPCLKRGNNFGKVGKCWPCGVNNLAFKPVFKAYRKYCRSFIAMFNVNVWHRVSVLSTTVYGDRVIVNDYTRTQLFFTNIFRHRVRDVNGDCQLFYFWKK